MRRWLAACVTGLALLAGGGVRLGQPSGRPGMVGVAGDAAVALAIARDPVVLEPADMACFPARRIELRGVRYLQFVAQCGDIGVEQAQGAGAARLQGGSENVAPTPAGGIGRGGIHEKNPGQEGMPSMPQACLGVGAAQALAPPSRRTGA